MSLTLRDAQHLSWKTFKKFEKIDQEKSKLYETGEKIMQKSVEIEQKIQTLQVSGASETEGLSKLLSELLFGAFILAEQKGVNLEESFLQTIDEMILSFVS